VKTGRKNRYNRYNRHLFWWAAIGGGKTMRRRKSGQALVPPALGVYGRRAVKVGCRPPGLRPTVLALYPYLNRSSVDQSPADGVLMK